MKKVAYNGMNGTVYIEPEEAIARQRRDGSRRGYEYESDEQALRDFICTNWAWYVDIDRGDGIE